MRIFLMAGAAALAFGAAPALHADDHMMEMSATQKSMYDSWPADRRSAYDEWPKDYQVYYWTLTPAQMDGWWVLTNDQRARVFAMTPEQRTAAWAAIANQMNGRSDMATTSTSTQMAGNTGAMSGNIRWVSNAVVQNTPADAGPPTGDLPICAPNAEDNCINAWEAGKRGPGVTKPLDYWPGKPASEM